LSLLSFCSSGSFASSNEARFFGVGIFSACPQIHSVARDAHQMSSRIIGKGNSRTAMLEKKSSKGEAELVKSFIQP
jgi:hypothetical protein